MALSTQAAHRKDLNADYSSMEHRHFATIAHILRALPTDVRDVAIEHFANELRSANLYGANLDSANLRSANLRSANLDSANLDSVYSLLVATSNRYIRTIYTGIYEVGYNHIEMQIGCQRHKISEWWEFSDERIVAMDGKQAIKFWRTWKPILQQLIAASPAEPTGYEAPVDQKAPL